MAIDAALSLDPDADLLGPFTAADADVEPLHVRKTIYLPAPFVGLFLERDITPAEAWNRLHGAIVDAGQEVDFWPIVNWLWVALKKKVRDNNSPLALPRPTTPFSNGDILRHRHHMLTGTYPG